MKKGFTLIELLAVIVILAIILVIAVPQVLKAIESSKKDSFVVTVDNLLDAASDYISTNYYEMKQLKEKTFTIENGEFVGDSIAMSGNLPTTGTIEINFNGTVKAVFKNSDWCAVKGKDDSEPIITDDVENCGLIEPAPEVCFDFEDGTILGYDFDNEECPQEELIIPDTIDGLAVTEIGSSAFEGFDWDLNEWRSGFTSIEIPNTVKIIGEYAFDGWDDNIEGCAGNITSITLPDGIESIGEFAFECNKIEDITIPSSLTEIDDGVFLSNNLSSITISESITSIGWGAFSNNQLTSLTIPDTVQDIYPAAFSNNQLPDNQAFIYYREDGVTDNTYLISYGGAKRDNVVIPNNIETLGDSAFADCQLTSVTIPSSVTYMDWSVFYNNQLTSVTIPSSITFIGPYSFYNNKLTSIDISNNVITIGSNAFSSNQLTNVIIGSGVTNIGWSTFQNNLIPQGNLTIDRTSGSVTIGDDAFSNNGVDGNTTITPVYLR